MPVVNLGSKNTACHLGDIFICIIPFILLEEKHFSISQRIFISIVFSSSELSFEYILHQSIIHFGKMSINIT